MYISIYKWLPIQDIPSQTLVELDLMTAISLKQTFKTSHLVII